MKNLMLLFSALFLFCTYTMQSQNDVNRKEPCFQGTNEYTERYVKLKTMYKKMLDSEESKKYMILVRDYMAKAHYAKRNWREEESTVNDWVLNNIEKTGFKDCAEAEAEDYKIVMANWEIMKNNEELYLYLAESLEICPDITSNLVMELTKEYGPYFKF
ncbi:hypothetical protein R1T16_09415 [Flavobacterium sp. DG1-102-2]|uniref:hypothetical protein n=1 Tax=Flavobacterium sp. DG1-102-2 TaxID=3081663 RepID=UPI0029496650|nr:hypothetical protein [Flavobacterium sp. DG1-102-2]MDV6168641.1 hypothetical protein [Flavobacterium sp. DG1-102-2]